MVEVDHDVVTGKRMGWEPIEQSAFHRAFDACVSFPPTYELIGPKVNGNQERVGEHVLVRHGQCVLEVDCRDYFHRRVPSGA